MMVIIEDTPSSTFNYASTILKCFCSDAIYRKDRLFFMGNKEILKDLHAPILKQEKPCPDSSIDSSSMEKMTIAWRYKHILKVDSEIGGSRNVSSSSSSPSGTINSNKESKSFDLSSKLNHEKYILNNEKVIVVNEISEIIMPSSSSLSSDDHQQNVTRVAIHGLGSPLLNGNNLMASSPLSLTLKDLIKLKSRIYCTEGYCMITASPDLLDESFLRDLVRISDYAIQLVSFDKNNINRQYYDGMVKPLKSLRIPGSLKLSIPDTTVDLAFKCNNKRMTIEKYHIPPSFDDSNNNNNSGKDGSSSISACSTAIDF